MSQLLQLYCSLGNQHYAGAIANLAPYFGTINPQFKELREGYCALAIPNTRAVHNHLGTLLPPRCAMAPNSPRASRSTCRFSRGGGGFRWR